MAIATWTQTMSVGRRSSYWTLPIRPCAASSTPSTVSGSRAACEAPWRRRSSHTPITSTPEHRRDRGVLVHDPLQGVGALEGEPVDALSRRAAGMRTGGGRGGAGDDRQRAERGEDANRPHPEPLV